MRDRTAVILGVSIIAAAMVFGMFFVRARAGEHTISVVGSAIQTFDSDVVKWRVNVVRTASLQTLPEAYAKIRGDIAEVVKQLIAHNIDEKRISVQPVSTHPVYEREGISGYRVQQSLYVISDSLTLIEKLALAPDTFASKGIIVEFSNLEYFNSQVDTLKVSLLGAAMKDARNRADEIAKGSGVKVGRIVSARSGVFQITEPYSNEAAAGGAYNTSSKTKDIRVTTHVTFTLK